MEHHRPDQPGVPAPPAAPAAAQPPEPHVELAVAQESRPANLLIDTTGGPKILVTEDRLLLVLGKHAGRLGGNWVAPLGILLSLGIALTTAEFKGTRLGVAADTWETVLLVVACIAAVWTAAALLSRFVFGGRNRRIKRCVEEIKKPKR